MQQLHKTSSEEKWGRRYQQRTVVLIKCQATLHKSLWKLALLGSFHGKAGGRETQISHTERAENYTQLVITSPPDKKETKDSSKTRWCLGTVSRESDPTGKSLRCALPWLLALLRRTSPTQGRRNVPKIHLMGQY